MAKTIFVDADRAALLDRVGQLSATAPARWGKFTAPKMVSHLIAAVRMALGELPCVPKGNILRFPPLRYLVIYVMPWPKGTPTAPEMLARVPESWDADIAELRAAVERAAANGRQGKWAVHPAFGALSADHWGALIHRHMDHHLTQFGV